VQRDADAPAIRRRPHEQRAEHDKRREAERVVRAAVPEIDQDDDRGDRQAIADDRERPGVAGIPFEYETAGRAAFEMVRPAGEERARAAVGAALREAAAQRGEDQPSSIYSASSQGEGCGPGTIPAMSGSSSVEPAGRAGFSVFAFCRRSALSCRFSCFARSRARFC
jgi:hypothetical protein